MKYLHQCTLVPTSLEDVLDCYNQIGEQFLWTVRNQSHNQILLTLMIAIFGVTKYNLCEILVIITVVRACSEALLMPVLDNRFSTKKKICKNVQNSPHHRGSANVDLRTISASKT